jgi:SAM-dependent methyltransferase
MKVFDNYAAYYDLLYKDKPYENEVGYIDDLIKMFSPDTRTILNLGCGTGKHDEYLAKKGYVINGIDLSSSMIEIANNNKSTLPNNIGENLHFMEGNIQHVRLNKLYDLVISLFHVMSYQNTDTEVVDSLKTASAHLKKGGVFIFDCWHKPAVMKDPPQIRKKIISDEKIKVKRTSTPNWIKESNIIEINFNIELSNFTDDQVDIIEEKHSMRYFNESEILNFAKNAGFKILKSVEWLTQVPASNKSWYVVYILQKL